MSVHEQFLAKIAANLENVANGLLHVKTSVEAAGYKDALPGYQQMKQTLLQQRMTSLQKMTPELQERWANIEQAARETQKILCAFGDVLGEIANVAKMGGDPQGDASDQVSAASEEDPKSE